MRYVIGADGGGTKTALRAYVPDGAGLRPVSDRIVCEGINYNFGSVETAAARLVEGVRRACVPGGTLIAVGLGDPACDDQVENEQSTRFRQAVEASLQVPVLTRSDVYMSLYGLTAGDPGVMVVSGTGSMGIGQDAAGQIHAVGGWGRITGDEGSGYWIARESLRAAMRAADGLEPPTALLDAALEWAGVREPRALIGYLYPPDGEREIAAFAARAAACAQTDGRALGILREAGTILAGYARRLLTLCGGNTVGIYGSVLVRNAPVRVAFEETLRAAFPDADVRVPDKTPEEAAAAYAWAGIKEV